MSSVDLPPSTCAGICFGTNYTILHLALPDNPSKPCLSCTKQWCLNQNLPICAGADLGETDPDSAPGKKGDVEARCFRAYTIYYYFVCPYLHIPCILNFAAKERDSPRDQLVVTLFLLTVFGLLLGAGIKGKMLKAGFDTSALAWNSGGRRWWEVRGIQYLLCDFSLIQAHSSRNSSGSPALSQNLPPLSSPCTIVIVATVEAEATVMLTASILGMTVIANRTGREEA